MSGFKLDTSGFVRVPENDGYGAPLMRVCWGGLPPFAQGYIEAALRGFGLTHQKDDGHLYAAFSDLAPATLAAMLEDCGRWRALHPSVEDHHGGIFWECRQVVSKVAAEGFPPVHLYLADDGKIHQREGGR